MTSGTYSQLAVCTRLMSLLVSRLIHRCISPMLWLWQTSWLGSQTDPEPAHAASKTNERLLPSYGCFGHCMLPPQTVSRPRAVACFLLSRLHVAVCLVSVYLHARYSCRSKQRVVACLCQSVVMLPIEMNNIDSCMQPLPRGRHKHRSQWTVLLPFRPEIQPRAQPNLIEQDARFHFTQLI